MLLLVKVELTISDSSDRQLSLACLLGEKDSLLSFSFNSSLLSILNLLGQRISWEWLEPWLDIEPSHFPLVVSLEGVRLKSETLGVSILIDNGGFRILFILMFRVGLIHFSCCLSDTFSVLWFGEILFLASLASLLYFLSFNRLRFL